jgi:drug/metabolite transporter (DMT)-like permease
VGRRATDPLAETGANFVLAVPLCALALALLPDVAASWTARGVLLAIASGAVTSGLGYALWYAVLPRLQASVSGLVQLSVPVIAMLGGVLILGEVLTLRSLGAGLLTLGGIAYGLGAFQRTRGSSGS